MTCKVIRNSTLLVAIFTLCFALPAFAQAPSAAQIEQFKKLPRSQQIALAQRMGVDITALQANASTTANTKSQAVDEVSRTVNTDQVSSELAEQSAIKTNTQQLKPFGYDLFESSETTFSVPANMPAPDDYVLGPSDTLKLQLYGKQTGQYELFVDSEGNVDIPELGRMTASGLTYFEFKQLIEDKYSRQMIGVTPYLSMGQLRTVQVFLVGEVFRPGTFTVSSLATVSNALFASGGVNNIGSLRNIQVKRAGKTVAVFDLYDVLIKGDTSNDIRLQQGDVVFVPPVANIVSIDGEVRRPAIYEIEPNENLTDLITIAGGVLPSAVRNKTRIARADENGELRVLSVNKSNTNINLRNGDFITIPKGSGEFNNAVLLIGAHASPGLMQWRPGLSLHDVINENALLNTTDINYGLVVRKTKLAQTTRILQFSPISVLDNETDIELLAYDQVVLFNQLQGQASSALEGAIVQSNSVGAETNASQQRATDNFLLALQTASFTEKQFILRDTQSASREKLLAPIIAQLRSESREGNAPAVIDVLGEVKFPGSYPISQNASISDALIAAGGVTAATHLEVGTITSLQLNAEGVAQTNHTDFNVLHAMQSDMLKLQPLDRLTLKRIPDWNDNRRVQIKGEVLFPGTYQIGPEETLASVIERAGGITERATVDAVIFLREELKAKETANLQSAVRNLREQVAASSFSNAQLGGAVNYTEMQSLLADLLEFEALGRMVVDFAGVLAGDHKADILLKDGDEIIVPNITPAVSIVGEVFVPSTHVFNDDASLETYLNKAGGLKEFADTSAIYIIKASGEVVTPQRSYWFASNQAVQLQPGDTIVVPRDIPNFDGITLWSGVTQIVYQTAVAIAAIGSL